MRLVDGRVVYAASDLNDYLACPHRVALNRRALLSGLRPAEDDPALEIVARKGLEHERRVLERLVSTGLTVVSIPEGDGSARDLRLSVERTRLAMREGAEAIYQAAFLEGNWMGRADFLMRVDAPSMLGPWSYEVVDTKLAMREKPRFLVQLCLYALFVAREQGTLPQSVRAVFGNDRQTAYDPARFVSFVRDAQQRFVDTIGGLDPAAVPERIVACEGCGWAKHCDDDRRAVDHLSLVAGMRRDQARRLATSGIATVERLGTAAEEARPFDMVAPTFETLRRQARLQMHQRETGELRYELLPVREQRGFAALPTPADGDVYFDMEGDPLYEAGRGLEYLFGAFVPGGIEPLYRPFWGETPDEEKRAFEGFVDWLVRHRQKHPEAHVYHYAAYEKTALRTLAMRHGTREEEVDDLLRGEVLVDLLAVVRAALAQSQDGYSIKKLEAFYGFERSADVRKGDQSIVAFEEYLLDREGAADRKDAIIHYNEEDCVSTWRLHRWLLLLRDEVQAEQHVDLPFRPRRDPHERTEEELKVDAERDEQQRELLTASPEGSPRALLANLLGYHRREEKPVWWELFDRYERDSDFVEDDREALGGLTLVPEVEPYLAGARDRNRVYTYAFPAQQHKISRGANAHDPHARKSIDVIEVDDDALLIRIKRAEDAPHPRALIPGEPINTKVQRKALRLLAQAVLDGTVTSRFSAAWDILTRARPRITGLFDGGIVQPVVRPGAEAIDCDDVADLALRLDESALVVQGPPGTGKTYTGARVILDLLSAGKRVGVTSTGHKAIHNLLHAIERAAVERRQTFRGVKKFDPKNEETKFASELGVPLIDSIKDNAPFGEFQLVAGTSWLMSRDDLAPVDYLVVDEAGQVALADVLAMATNASNVILLGDPLQLAHVSTGTHSGGAGASVLEHLLYESDDIQRGTVPPDRGVFLNRTFRMHPALCDFLSAMVYEGRLHSAASCALQRIDAPWFHGAGLRYVPVEHQLNAHSSEEESAEVERIVAGLVGGTFTDRFGQTRTLGPADVLVVSPYNAQVSLLKRVLRARFGNAVRIGTVDKFQGQEAPVVIYSLATSSTEDAPRGTDFLFEENRFNVALSRGRALAVLVCSPVLLAARCTTVEQLRAVATFCAFKEVAAAQAGPPALGSGARPIAEQIPLFT